MPKARSGVPKQLIQVEVPLAMVGALDLLAKQKSVTRSWLIRAVLGEYLELKFGPDLRKGIAAWERVGEQVMSAFIAQQVPALAPTGPAPRPISVLEPDMRITPPERMEAEQPFTSTMVDPMCDRNYAPNPEDPNDPLHKLVEGKRDDTATDPPQAERSHWRTGTNPTDPIVESLDASEVVARELEAPRLTEREFRETRPNAPTPEHFPVKFPWED